MTCFRAEQANRHLPSNRRFRCLNCLREVIAELLVVTLLAGDEPIGFVCSNCVSSDARELLRTGGGRASHGLESEHWPCDKREAC